MKERLEVSWRYYYLSAVMVRATSNDENKGHSCLLPCSSNEALMY